MPGREGPSTKSTTTKKPSSSTTATASPTKSDASRRHALRGMTFDQGAAALTPSDGPVDSPAPASSRPNLGSDSDSWDKACFDVSAQIGEKGWRTNVNVEGVDDPEAFIASLEARWPTTTPLHELPYAMELAIINWGHFHAGLGDDPEVRHVFTERTPTGQFVVADAIEQMGLDTYKRSPATIAHLRQ